MYTVHGIHCSYYYILYTDSVYVQTTELTFLKLDSVITLTEVLLGHLDDFWQVQDRHCGSRVGLC